MQVRKLAVTGVMISASWLALGVSTPAFALCEAYSGGCPSTPPNGGGGGAPIGGGTDQPGSGNVGEPGSGEQPTAGNPGTGTGANPGGSTSNPSTLPFTGGELVLMTAVGAGALAGGTALVVAGRRRAQSA